MIIVSNWHTKDKTSGFRSDYHIKIHILYHFQELVNGQMKALSIL